MHNILSFIAVYLGPPGDWEKILTQACLELKISLLKTQKPNDLSELFSRKENMVVFVSATTHLDISSLPEKTKKNKILISVRPSHTEETDVPESNLNHFDDVLIETTSVSHLKKSLQFYRQSFNAQEQLARILDSHDTIKRNLSLTHQVINLQEQLNQFNSNLQTQEEVLDKISKISHLSRQINCLNLKRISLICIERIPQLIAARFASMYVYDEEQDVLQLLRHNHPYAIDEEVRLEEHPNSPMAIAIKQKKTLLIRDFNDWKDEVRLDVHRPYERNYLTNSCIVAPLHSSGHIAGLLNLADKSDSSGFDHLRDMPPVELLCEIIGSAMSNIKLYEEVRRQASTDGMTQLFNHNTFYNELDKEVNRSRRYGGHLSLIMVDLDCLKNINDEHGHRAGDIILKHVSDVIKHCIRETDIPARYGGDEFGIILPNTSLADALVVAQRMLDHVAGHDVEIEGTTLRASISIGIAQYQSHYSTDTFVREADSALLNSKNSGKNCIHVADTIAEKSTPS